MFLSTPFYFYCYLFVFHRGILSNFIFDPSLQSALPVFCLADAEDGERTSVLGIEKGRNNELIRYKITVAGPITSTDPTIQLDHLKSEMAFLTNVEEVGIYHILTELTST